MKTDIFICITVRRRFIERQYIGKEQFKSKIITVGHIFDELNVGESIVWILQCFYKGHIRSAVLLTPFCIILITASILLAYSPFQLRSYYFDSRHIKVSRNYVHLVIFDSSYLLSFIIYLVVTTWLSRFGYCVSVQTYSFSFVFVRTIVSTGVVAMPQNQSVDWRV